MIFRSPKSSVDIFARALLDKGIISNIELETLKEISDKVEPLCCKVGMTSHYSIFNLIFITGEPQSSLCVSEDSSYCYYE